MDYREASVCFFKMSNLRRNVTGRRGCRGGGELGESCSLCYIWHYYCLQTVSIVPLPLCQRQKTANYSVYFCLCILGSPVKPLPCLQAGSGSFLRVQLMLNCHPFLWCNLNGAYRKAEERHIPRGIHSFADRSYGFGDLMVQ